MAARLAELKAASTRLDALGERLVKLGQLDPEEFDFSQTIARMGATGRASSPHVHFEVLYQGKAVNPYQFVKQMR